MKPILSRSVLSVWMMVVVGLQAKGDETISFDRQIRPIFSDRCFECHGASEEARQGELRLDAPGGRDGPFRGRDGYQVIQPKDLAASALWKRLTTTDESERMPPVDSHKKPLTDEEHSLIKQWILQGAEYEDFWAFVPPQRRPDPEVKDDTWLSQRIDRFVLARLEKENLKPQPPADKRTLIRRASLDLTGLPPTPEEIHRFVDDASPDAYANLVERLIASPQYGEHMAKYWLDLVRFADTNGIHHDHYREMTPYRDWVIQSFNENLRFDDFITYQVAGDLYEQPTLDQQIASGFNRLHLVIDRGTALPEESYTRNVVDRVSAVGTAFMGLTLGCAVCHDHKYDPLTQKDFYQLFAFFNNIDTTPETPGKSPHPPFIRLPSAEQSDQLKSLESRIAVATVEIKQLKEAKSAESELKLKEEELQSLTKSKTDLESTIPVTLVSKERADIQPAYILKRGVYDQPGEEVSRNTPAFLPSMGDAEGLRTRMDLARWLTDDKHPLTSRVTVNRFWQQFFGVGLVKTSEDFGAQGEYPSHPDLLDDLASGFMHSQWDVKSLVRSIVLSQTYQQSSRGSVDAFRTDPDNRLLARGSRFRLDSEMIRDQALAMSGLLNATMFGKSVKPPQPPNLWKSVSMVSSSTYSFEADTDDKIYRRSIYSFWKRAMPPPQMTIFDAPTRESCIARRERTNTPVQALVLMNESQFFLAAQQFAHQLVAKKELSEEERLIFAYESVTSHLPDSTELASLRSGLEGLKEIYQEDIAAANTMTTDIELTSDQARIEVASYTMLVNSLFNLDVTKTRE
ncbi:MAG: PSD1 domain-containing protein [Planctomycetes bacterium]|nr:PSD1 domain-containing protein [Planctomycetota bacterium]